MLFAQQSTRPNAAQGTSKTDSGDRLVAAQKPSQQHLAGETSLLRDLRSPTVVARVLVTSGMNHRSGYRVGEGFYRTGVTVEPCQWETSQQNSTGSSINLERSTIGFVNRQTTLRRHKLVVVLSSVITFGDSCKFLICVELAQAVEFVGKRDRFVGHLSSRGRCVLSLAIATWASVDFTTEVFSSSHQVVRIKMKPTQISFAATTMGSPHHPRCITVHKKGIEIYPSEAEGHIFLACGLVGGTQSHNDQQEGNTKTVPIFASDGCSPCIGIQRSPRC